MLTPTQRAAAMIRHFATSTDPDRRTSLADARIALCVAAGVDMADIDPSFGYDCSRRAYDRSRESWIRHVQQAGYSDFYNRGLLNDMTAYWVRRRPQFIAGDDWRPDAEKAHRAYWEQPGRSCDNPHCDFHPSDDHAELLRIIAEQEAPAEVAESGPGVQQSLFD